MSVRAIKLNFQGMETLFAELSSPEKQVIHLLVSGNDTGPKFTKLTTELVNIIAFLCKKLNWIEDVEGLDCDEDRKLTSEINKNESKEEIMINRNVSDHTEDPENKINTSTDTGNDLDTFEDLVKDNLTMTEGEGKDTLKENCTEPDTVMTTTDKTHKGLQSFSCTYCQKFISKKYVSKHEKICKTKKFSCSYCEKKFYDMLKLSHHESSHRGEKLFTCSTCDKKFTTSKHLKRHERIHTGDLLSCNQCDKKFTRAEHLKRHEKIHTGENVFLCTHCDKKFSRKDKLKKHERQHNELQIINGQDNKQECEKGVLSKSDNETDQGNENNTSMTPCTENNSESFENLLTDENLPMKEAVGEDAIEGNSSKPTENLPIESYRTGKEKMEQIHTGEAINDHESSHRYEKPFTCCTCGKNFTFASHLKRHEISHLGNLFGCTICDKKFSRIERLKSHQRIHTGDLLSCNQCDKKFTRAEHLKRHEKIHNIENFFVCIPCDKTFNRADNLKAHERQHHKLNIKPFI